jgi:type I restriction enzyme M protein
LANPPFADSLDYASTSGKLQRVVKTKKTELLFMALFLHLLKSGGRAAVIVPDGVLFGSSNAHKELRRTLVEDHFLEGVVSLPSGGLHDHRIQGQIDPPSGLKDRRKDAAGAQFGNR